MAGSDAPPAHPLVREAFPHTIRLVASARLRDAVLSPLADDDDERESERIVTGNAQDFADYKFQAGIIRGLNIAHELISEVNTEIAKAEQGEK